MADDSRKTKGTDDGDSKQSGGAIENAGGGKHKGMPGFLVPLVIVSVLVALAGVGVGGYILFTQMQTAQAATGEDTEGGTEEPVTDTNIYFEGFPEGVVNLAVTEDSPFTYLKYAFSIELDNEEVIEEIETKLPRLTSIVAAVMSNLDWNEICTTEGRERVAREAMGAINRELEDGQVIGLYFDTFVAQ
jgi:flagellar basal body-associated protein FliL